VLKFLKNSIRLKFRFISLVLISTFLSLFSKFGGSVYHNSIGSQTVEIIFNIPILIILGIVSLGYMKLMYEKEWFGGKYRSKKRKYFQILSFAFIGLVAAYTPYLFGIGNVFFGYVDYLNGGHNTTQLHLLTAYAFVLTFLTSDMFNSLDGKSGILFKVPKLILVPLRNYNSLEYKIDKFFRLV
jgi:hypothetical protein